MNSIEKNIANLFSVWKTAGLITGGYTAHGRFEVSTSNRAEWPNKLWFKNAPDKSTLESAVALMRNAPQTLSIAEFSTLPLPDPAAFGLAVKNVQTGMSLELDRDFPENTDELRLERVYDHSQALIWSELFTRSFGYRIDSTTVADTRHSFQYFVAWNGHTPVGTVMLHGTDVSIAGIHSMGILPEQRKKGYARALLMQTLCRAQSDGFMHAVLQASEAALPLYQSIGFETQFTLQNLILKNSNNGTD